MVASGAPARLRPDKGVSIPFIAGQWSLLNEQDSLPTLFAHFNPLHCGAVVASWRRSGYLELAAADFNPLHCGAVVASLMRGLRTITNYARFQSPSLRGSGRFTRCACSAMPFVLLYFNPLHCGAVVASGRHAGRGVRLSQAISIPFIAGQWSLHAHVLPASTAKYIKFQSPSLRGSGRFHMLAMCAAAWAISFQSPSLRGSGRFHPSISSKGGWLLLFQSPSLRGSGRFSLNWFLETDVSFLFQSPSLRGSGRFWAAVPKDWNKLRSQSPSLRGSGRFQ